MSPRNIAPFSATTIEDFTHEAVDSVLAHLNTVYHDHYTQSDAARELRNWNW